MVRFPPSLLVMRKSRRSTEKTMLIINEKLDLIYTSLPSNFDLLTLFRNHILFLNALNQNHELDPLFLQVEIEAQEKKTFLMEGETSKLT
jgi:hypothetical protein